MAVSWFVGLAVSGVCAVALWGYRQDLANDWPVGLALTIGAVLAIRLSRRSVPRTPRLAMTFVLAGLMLLAPPAAVLVGLVASLSGRGVTIAGRHGAGIASYSAFALAMAAAGILTTIASPGGERSRLGGSGLLLLAVLSVMLPLSTAAFQRLLDGGGAGDDGLRRTLWLESINLPLAGLLTVLVNARTWLPAIVTGMLVLGAALGFRRWSRTTSDLRRSRAMLDLRTTELDTLHAIGREILSSLEPLRVCAVIERECRKIFEVDSFFIALAESDASRLNIIYRRESGGIAVTESEALPPGFENWMLERKRALRIDDRPPVARRTTHLRAVLQGRMRSALAVPLIVGDRVIGVLCIQCARSGAYDDHQLSVLTTIGQQAAVAFENARHRQLATVDSLTGFFVKDHFFRRLDEEYRRAQRYGGVFSLLMLDLDGFKELNDKHGHLAGDGYLRAISGTILSGLRAADLACRYGGDEFCLMLPETDLHGARAIAERIREAISNHVVALDGLTLRTTASIGVATFPDHDRGAAKALIGSADEALYRAKRAGRDCVVPFAA